MNICCHYRIYILFDSEIRALGLRDTVVVAFLTFVGVTFAILHAIYHFTLAFQLFFGVLAWTCIFRLVAFYYQIEDRRAKNVARSCVFTMIFGFSLWLLDYHYCSHLSSLPFNPQGHAWWHIFSGLGSYHGPVFMQYVRAEQQQKKAKIVVTPLGIHTIVIDPIDDEYVTYKHKTL